MNKIIYTIIFAFVLLTNADDNEIYVNQTGSNASIDLEQLGSSNIIGGSDSVAGTMTKATLNGGSMTLDINQIGSSNQFLTGGLYGSDFTGFFEFDGDSNIFDIDLDTSGLNGADFVDLNIDITGSSNTFDVDLGESSAVDYLNLDWIIDGDSNAFDYAIDSEYATNYVDLFGDSNTINFTGSGYGNSSTDAGYFYLDLTGSSNVYNITQSSTLAADWLKIESNGSNQNVCIIQSDSGTATSC
tara:strand:+ start:487 stop:1215 length:729 start_codon:yes stop_codon:yes gene_type:complete